MPSHDISEAVQQPYEADAAEQVERAAKRLPTRGITSRQRSHEVRVHHAMSGAVHARGRHTGKMILMQEIRRKQKEADARTRGRTVRR